MLERQEARVTRWLWADRAVPRVEGGGLGEDGRASLQLLKGMSAIGRWEEASMDIRWYLASLALAH